MTVVGGSMRQSIIRRSFFVSAVFVAGHLFHYALMVTANRLLAPDPFGRLYAAISLLNVLYTPATVLTFLFAQHFTVVYTAAGRDALVGELKRLFAKHAMLGAGVALATAALLLLSASATGADAFILLMLVPCTALAVYLFEVARSAFQGMLAFFAYSAAWIAWRAGQYVLAVIGILLTGTAWSAMAGILLATIIAIVVMLGLIVRGSGTTAPTADTAAWPPFRALPAIPFAIEYGIFVLMNNIDVLIAYLVLSNDELGIYAASSVLPKAIVTATHPVSQVMLPVMTASERTRAVGVTAVVKALIVTGVAGTAGAAALYFGRNAACNTWLGLRFCSTELLTTLAIAATPLGMLRVLVVASLAAGRSDMVLVAIPALIAVAAAIFIRGTSTATLAEIYLVCCWGFLILYACAMLTLRRAAA